MDPLTIVALLNALAQLTPSVISLAQQASGAMSAQDQASINAAIAQLQAAANIDVNTAITDLDAAAKS